MRYVLVDRITSLTPGQTLRAIKNVTAADAMVTRHGPGLWVFQAAMVLEAMAQAAGLLAIATTEGRVLPVLAKVRLFTSHRHAVPGDQLCLEARLEDVRAEGCRASVTASVDNMLAADAAIYLGFVALETPAAAGSPAPVLAALTDSFPGWFPDARLEAPR
jgi:3-hydroxyacyl-[acyl-carrier-protein] dehydratase